MTTTVVTQAVIAAELEAASAWADRRGWRLSLASTGLSGAAVARHPAVGRDIVFLFDLTDYPTSPPSWWCGTQEDLDHLDDIVAPTPAGYAAPFFPAPATTVGPGGPSGSIFHPNRLICAPWNRLAFAKHGGPHPDWSIGDWRSAGAGYTQAHSIGEMLSALHIHLLNSPGLMP